MPHNLIAADRVGQSGCIHTILTRSAPLEPDEVRLLLIDPKQVSSTSMCRSRPAHAGRLEP